MAIVAEPKSIRVSMAGLECGQAPDALETLLGSCVGIAIWDRQSRRGGLAHIVLPESRGTSGPLGKYADTAVAELRRQLLAHGCNPTRLTAKIAGGSTMFGQRSERDVGEKNCQAVLEHLARHNIPVLAKHLGGNQGRIIRFALEDGSVTVSISRQVVAVI